MFFTKLLLLPTLLLLTTHPTLTRSLDCPEPSSTLLTEPQLLLLSSQCFTSHYINSHHNGHQILHSLHQRLSHTKHLLQTLKMQNIAHTQTTPVVKWAQSQTQIYIKFKLSHRQDSPTCSDIRHQELNLTNIPDLSQAEASSGHFDKIPSTTTLEPSVGHSSLHFTSECYLTTQKLMFKLELHFEKLLSRVTFKREGLGSYTIIGDKFERVIWYNPFNNCTKAAIWNEMRKKYSADMDSYFDEVERRKEEQGRAEGDNRKKSAGSGSRRRKRPVSATAATAAASIEATIPEPNQAEAITEL